jgi:hypothetical protein
MVKEGWWIIYGQVAYFLKIPYIYINFSENMGVVFKKIVMQLNLP